MAGVRYRCGWCSQAFKATRYSRYCSKSCRDANLKLLEDERERHKDEQIAAFVANEPVPAGYAPRTETTPCYYCGMPAGDIEHAVPRASLPDLQVLGISTDEGSRTWTVASCRECNVLAGATLFPTLAQRKAYIKSRIRKRYRKIINCPRWTDSELAQLGYSLRTAVLETQAKRDEVIARLKW